MRRKGSGRKLTDAGTSEEGGAEADLYGHGGPSTGMGDEHPEWGPATSNLREDHRGLSSSLSVGELITGACLPSEEKQFMRKKA